MRHELNWLEYLRKLANEGAELSLNRRHYFAGSRVGMATPHASQHRDEWLQAGYPAQVSMPSRSSR